jgi:hypothetical protein
MRFSLIVEDKFLRELERGEGNTLLGNSAAKSAYRRIFGWRNPGKAVLQVSCLHSRNFDRDVALVERACEEANRVYEQERMGCGWGYISVYFTPVDADPDTKMIYVRVHCYVSKYSGNPFSALLRFEDALRYLREALQVIEWKQTGLINPDSCELPRSTGHSTALQSS